MILHCISHVLHQFIRHRDHPSLRVIIGRVVSGITDIVPVEEEHAPSLPPVDGSALLSQPPLRLRGVHPTRLVSPRPLVFYHETVKCP